MKQSFFRNRQVRLAIILAAIGALGAIASRIDWIDLLRDAFSPQNAPFRDADVSLLLLPFTPLDDCALKDEDLARAVARSIMNETDHTMLEGLSIKVLSNSTCPMSHSDAREIGRDWNADIVVWGDHYEKCYPETSLACIRYTIVDENAEVVRKEGNSQTRLVRPDYVFQGNLAPEVTSITFFLLGQYHYSVGDLQNAIAAFEVSLAQDVAETPRAESMIHFQIGTVWGELSEYSKALESFDRAYQLDPTNYRARVNRGVCLFQIGLRDSARVVLNDVVDFSPTTCEEYSGRGVAHIALGNDSLALLDLTHAINLRPTSVSPLVNRARIYLSLGNYHGAIDDLNRALQIRPHYSKAYSLRAEVNFFANDPNRSLMDFDTAIVLNPCDFNALAGRAQVRCAVGRIEDALADCDSAVSLAPMVIMSHLIRSNVYVQAGDYEKAITDCSKALQLDPNRGQSYAFRGSVYLHLRMFEKSINDFNAALSLGLDAVAEKCAVLAKKAEALIALGKYAEAGRACEVAIHDSPNYATAHYNRAVAYAMMNRPQEAMNSLVRATRSGIANLVTREQILADTSFFRSIRDLPEFKQWLDRYR